MSLSETVTLFLDTRFAVNPRQPADGEWLTNLRLDEYGKSLVAVESASIPLTRPPIFSANNRLVFSENGGFSTDLEVTLDQREYTGTSIATEIGTKMTAASLNAITYTCTFDNNTKKLTLSADVLNFRIEPTSTCLKETGFIADATYASSIVGNSTVRLDGPLFLDIVSNLNVRNISSDTRRNILARIPVTSVFGSVLYYQNPSSTCSDFVNEDLQNISMRLIDDEGRLYEVDSTSSVQFTVRLMLSGRGSEF